MSEIIVEATVWVIPVLIAITFHEAAHGWAAWKLGDDTAKVLGRVTFNPFRHIDPFGTLLLPALLLFLSGGRVMFGYAKPVPVAFHRLRRPRRDMVLVAAAGPAVNLALATGAAVAFHLLPFAPGAMAPWLAANLVNAIWLNLVLCVFNMLPLPPLDGGRVAVGLLPAPLAIRLARLEPYGFAIIIGALFFLPWIGGTLGLDLNVFRWLVGEPVQFLTGLLTALVGLR